MTTIYKICHANEWAQAEREGAFRGTAVDFADGFIHFSTAQQVTATAARHFGGVTELVLVAIRADGFGDALKWETARGGDRFPHLYGSLPLSSVAWVKPLLLDDDGRHVFPRLED